MSRRSERDDDFPPDLIDREEAIDLVIDAVLIGSKPLRRMTKDILKQERKLRRSVDDDAWKVFLKLEELLNERASKQMDGRARPMGARGRCSVPPLTPAPCSYTSCSPRESEARLGVGALGRREFPGGPSPWDGRASARFADPFSRLAFVVPIACVHSMFGSSATIQERTTRRSSTEVVMPDDLGRSVEAVSSIVRSWKSWANVKAPDDRTIFRPSCTLHA